MSWSNSIRSRLELGWLIFTLTYLKARKKTVKIFIQAIKKPDCKCFQFALVIKSKGVYGFFTQVIYYFGILLLALQRKQTGMNHWWV